MDRNYREKGIRCLYRGDCNPLQQLQAFTPRAAPSVSTIRIEVGAIPFCRRNRLKSQAE